MEIWLKQVDELRLPVLPSGFESGVSQQNTIVNVTSYGEVNLIGKRSLKTISLSSFFPAKEYGFVQYKGFPEPYECVQMIESWMDNPVQLIITGTDISMQTTIESFTHSEQDATGDVYYTIELKEYKKPSLSEDVITSKLKASVIILPFISRVSKPVKTTTYTVKKNDTLYDIAKKLTGSGQNYHVIAKQNGLSKPYTLKVGQKLVIKV